MLYKQHWILITNITSFVKKLTLKPEFCDECSEGIDDGNDHCCEMRLECDRCQAQFRNRGEFTTHQRTDASGAGGDRVWDELVCKYCNSRNFYSEQCLNHHEIVCRAAPYFLMQEDRERIVLSERARNRLREMSRPPRVRNRSDLIRSTACSGCNVKDEDIATHVCFLEKREERDSQMKEIYAFDYESMLVPHPSQPGVSIHEVNLVCVANIDDPINYNWAFINLQEFFEWLRDYLVPRGQELGGEIGMFAHNLRGYDGRLTLTKMFADQRGRGALVDDMIWVGGKINCFKYQNILFRDSLLHIAQPLAQFPKTFNLRGEEVELSKGFFPYIFNTPENQQYVGRIPAITYFEPGRKYPEERKKLLAWYEQHKDDEYDFQDELYRYCIADVIILAKGLKVYQQAGKLLNGEKMDPLDSITIASYTTNVWFTNYFPERTIAWHNQTLADNAREALRGGKTDVKVFYRKYSLEDVFVRKRYATYIDVQSMYPFVMHRFEYPTGKGELLWGSEPTCTVDKLRQLFGFAKVTINPPDHFVQHPALVHKRNGRLCATLEPWINQVFTTVELCDALDQGWTVSHIEWIQWYPSKSTKLFAAYIEKLVSEKIHSSKIEGTVEELELLAEKWKREFNIEFNAAMAEFNAGRRALAKLMLNSLWGKLSERFKNLKTVNVTAAQFLDLEKYELTGKIVVKQKEQFGPDAWLMKYEDNLHSNIAMISHLKKTCVEIGAYVTMYGRRMLWQEMVKLGARVMYHDTDSIIYEYDEAAEYNTQAGHILGDWEVEEDGNPIIEFVALAPKTYAYKILNLKKRVPITEVDSIQGEYMIWEDWVYPVEEHCKMKGFKLTYDACQKINFAGLLELFRQHTVELRAEQLMFEYNSSTGVMTSRVAEKAAIFNYEKGLIGNYPSNDLAFPYGSEKYWDPNTKYCQEGDRIRVRSFNG